MMNSVFSMRTEAPFVFALLLVLSLLQDISPAWAQSLALTGATVHPVSSEAIVNGVVLVRNGLIEAVGSDLAIPSDAEIIDLSGLHLYPGFVHPGTQLGLTEISSVAGTIDSAEMGQINAALRVEVAVNHDSELLPTSIAGGILSAHIIPSGGLIRGSSAVLRSDGWSWEEMVIQAPSGLHIAFPPGAADDADHEDLRLLNRVLDQARHYQRALAAASEGRGPQPLRNDQLEALQPLLNESVPLMLSANGERVIQAALDWAEHQSFSRMILIANVDAQHFARRLADAGIPVILQNPYGLPIRRWEAYDSAFAAPASLYAAGVKFAIGDSGGGMDVANARNLPFQAGTSVAHGLPAAAALQSVTLWPAEILGVSDRLGSIEPGKHATLFAATGDALEPMTQIRHVWIDGRPYDLSRDRSRRLYERYRARQSAPP